jgi:hypothetical protein
MFKKAAYLFNQVFASRRWEPEYAGERMRRWRAGQWEYREMTAEESAAAYDMWAMK